MNINLKIGAISVFALVAMVVSIMPSDAQNRFDNRHPRRAQTLRRDANLNRRVNANRGDLNGHYGQIKREDRTIRRQEQNDSRIHGGHITRGEQRQINREENHVSNQIKRDQR